MALSPMMQQYVNTKEEYKDALLLFRVGDFYELYFEDAITASEELDIYLTGRDCGLEKKIEMSGVPHHSVEPYIAKLVQKGYKVAICEQVGAPEDTGKKGALFKREVVRVITPGTLIDSPLLDEEKNNYIASVYYENGAVGVSWSDISTGEFNHSFIEPPIAVPLGELLTKINPAEIICNSAMQEASVSLSIVKYGMVCPFNVFLEPAFEYKNALAGISKQFTGDSFAKIKKYPACVSSAGALVVYLEQTQKRHLGHIMHSKNIRFADSMYIDYNARKHLELCENMSDNSKRGSLLWLINHTSTKPGARLLRKIVLQPYVNAERINANLDAVEELLNDRTRDKLKAILKDMADTERLVGKLSYGSIAPKEVLRLAETLALIPALKHILSVTKCNTLQNLNAHIVDYPEIYQEIIAAISVKAPQYLRDGDVFNSGYDKELDEYNDLKHSTSDIIKSLELAERAETGLKGLKIDYTRNFGYYIELPRSQVEQVPFRYVRRQTLKNTERYTTEELKILEEKILAAGSNALVREDFLFKTLLQKVSLYIDQFLSLTESIAELDVLVSHANVSKSYHFTRPVISQDVKRIALVQGRHPVVEKLLKGEEFVPNDTLLDDTENRIMLITGPNMAGKSVYMRQVAIITILAHIGCFVPAKKAEIPITDKIFTRVGAGDDMLTGRSTFMVEMSEVASILDNLSDNSLVLMDEIGRGTSTYDGLSIAWAILEYLDKHSKAKVLFSTHYHELTDLEDVLQSVKNYKLTLREMGGSIVFLRKLMRGSANRSFGIEVAQLAGLPIAILSRAKELLKQLENSDVKSDKMPQSNQISIFGASAHNQIVTILNELDVDNISPRHALDILIDLKEKAEKNETN